MCVWIKGLEECRISSLLFADHAVPIAESEECFQRIVNEIGVVCGEKKLK